MEKLLECKGISMNFGITKALINVDFSVEPGKIYGLVGENGSGKSTLSSIIAGIHTPVAGTMTFKGQPWKPASSLYASQHGVGIIVQEAGTIAICNVAQNIFLGQESKFSKFGLVNMGAMIEKAQSVLDDIGANFINAGVSAMALNMQTRKIVEIAKAYTNDPDLLIVDETTNALAQDGRDILFNLMHRLAKAGKSVLVISHDIEEVCEHCDEVTVLKDGRVAANLTKEELSPKKIKELMIGRELVGNFYRGDNDGYSDEVVLEVKDANALHQVTGINLQLHKGEILGIGGLSDCGMHILGKMLFGEEIIAKGSVTLTQKGIRITNPEVAVKNGVAYISKDRDKESLAADASISVNVASTGFDENRIKKILFSFKKERTWVDMQVDGPKIKCNSKHDQIRSLSGGNKQKVAFGKWFARNADIMILDCPTRGIDIGVKQEMYRLMYEMKKQGKAIVIISEELGELIGMSDRLLVMKDGRITKELFRKDGMTEQEIIEYMV